MAARESDTELWLGGVIPYEINPDLGNTDAIEEAIRVVEGATSLRLVRHYLQDDFVRFSKQTQGNSNSVLGCAGGEQFLNASGNDVGTLVHELGHALGLTHEHQRSDRDDHLIMHEDRIPAGQADQYDKRDTPWRSDYDFNSVMHYAVGDPNAPIFESKTGVPSPQDIGGHGTLTPTDLSFIAGVYPSPPVVRRSAGDGGAGGVWSTSAVAVPGVNNTAVVANAVTNASGDYQLVLWRIRTDGVVQRMGDPAGATAGTASAPQIVTVASGFVTAMRDGSGDILLISHDANGARVHDSNGQAGEVSALAIVAVSPTRVLTPCINGSGRVLCIAWDIAADGSIHRAADSGTNGPVARWVSATMLADGVTAAVLYQDDSSRLVLSTWSTGSSVARITDSGAQMGEAEFGQVTATAAGPVVVSCQAANGELLLIPFAIPSGGGTISRVAGADARAGVIRELAATQRPYGILTSVISDGGTVLLIKWGVNADGSIDRLGESGSQAGEGTLLSATALPFPAGSTVCTTLRNGSGDLLPITWDDLDGPGELDRLTPPGVVPLRLRGELDVTVDVGPVATPKRNPLTRADTLARPKLRD